MENRGLSEHLCSSYAAAAILGQRSTHGEDYLSFDSVSKRGSKLSFGYTGAISDVRKCHEFRVTSSRRFDDPRLVCAIQVGRSNRLLDVFHARSLPTEIRAPRPNRACRTNRLPSPANESCEVKDCPVRGRRVFILDEPRSR